MSFCCIFPRFFALILYFLPPFSKRLINDTRTRNVRTAGYALMCIRVVHGRNPGSASVYMHRGNNASAVVEDYDGPRAVFSYARIIGMHDVPSGRRSQCMLHSYCTIIEAYQFRFAPSESCTGTTDNEIDTGNPYSRETHASRICVDIVISSACDSNEARDPIRKCRGSKLLPYTQYWNLCNFFYSM